MLNLFYLLLTLSIGSSFQKIKQTKVEHAKSLDDSVIRKLAFKVIDATVDEEQLRRYQSVIDQRLEINGTLLALEGLYQQLTGNRSGILPRKVQDEYEDAELEQAMEISKRELRQKILQHREIVDELEQQMEFCMREATISRGWYLQEIQQFREIADTCEEHAEVNLPQQILERRREENALEDLEKAVELRHEILEQLRAADELGLKSSADELEEAEVKLHQKILERQRAADKLGAKVSADVLEKAEVEFLQEFLERQRAADELGVKFSADELERVQADLRQEITGRRGRANELEESMSDAMRRSTEHQERLRRAILERRRAAYDLEVQL